MNRAALATALVAAALTAATTAQSRNPDRRGAGCDDRNDSDRPSYCETREETIATGAVNPLEVDAGRNGGIRVRGSDRLDVHMLARVSASADTEAQARQVVSAVRIVTGGGSIHAEGPTDSGGN